MIADMLSKLKNKNNLSYDEISNAMEDILSGNVSDENISDFLKSLRDKGESDDELLGMLDKMQAFALHISPKRKGTIIYVCSKVSSCYEKRCKCKKNDRGKNSI